jgi:hypothetical protein
LPLVLADADSPLNNNDEKGGRGEVGRSPRVSPVGAVAQAGIELLELLPPPALRTPPLARTSAASRLTSSAAARPSFRSISVSRWRARMVRNVSTAAAGHSSPESSAAVSVGAAVSKVIAKSVAYSDAIASRPAASTIASLKEMSGSCDTSWASADPRPPGAASRIAR